MSPLLQDFYNEMYRIICDDSYRPEWFDCEHGLCWNLWKYLKSVGADFQTLSIIDFELTNSFLASGLCSEYPFNRCIVDFEKENKYTNPKRLAWIRQHASIGEI